MEATTVGALGNPEVAAAIEVPQAETGARPRPVVKALHHAWWFSLGLVVVAGEQTVKLVKAAVARGKDMEPSLKPPFQKAERGLSEALTGVGTRLKGVGSLLGKKAGAVESALDERIAKALTEAGAPLMTEMEELKRKVEELATKLEGLQTKREKPERASRSEH
jgi:polyhydroxyalkanoate synthesis regulator phasin